MNGSNTRPVWSFKPNVESHAPVLRVSRWKAPDRCVSSYTALPLEPQRLAHYLLTNILFGLPVYHYDNPLTFANMPYWHESKPSAGVRRFSLRMVEFTFDSDKLLLCSRELYSLLALSDILPEDGYAFEVDVFVPDIGL